MTGKFELRRAEDQGALGRVARLLFARVGVECFTAADKDHHYGHRQD